MKKLNPLRRAYIELFLTHGDAKAMIIRLNAIARYSFKRVTGGNLDTYSIK